MLHYIIYRSRNSKFCRAKQYGILMYKVTVLEEFLHTVLLYQVMTIRTINILAPSFSTPTTVLDIAIPISVSQQL